LCTAEFPQAARRRIGDVTHEIIAEPVRIGPDGFDAHLARPVGDGPFPGVIVGFEMFGLTGYVRGLVERIAALGYVVVAPDFYHRAGRGIELTTAERERGLTLVAELSRDGVLADLRNTVEFLRDKQSVTGRLGAAGFSFGGHLAYLAATELDIAATVVFYGGWLTSTDIALGRPAATLDRTADITGSVLFLVGDNDHAVPMTDVEEIESRLTRDRVPHEVVVYPDTPHGFFADGRESYRAKVAEDAWARLTAFFAAALG
jgi:carboxymethylenebutenolidase